MRCGSLFSNRLTARQNCPTMSAFNFQSHLKRRCTTATGIESKLNHGKLKKQASEASVQGATARPSLDIRCVQQRTIDRHFYSNLFDTKAQAEQCKNQANHVSQEVRNLPAICSSVSWSACGGNRSKKNEGKFSGWNPQRNGRTWQR